MGTPKYRDVPLSEAWATFLHRTCDACKKHLHTLGPCDHCGDQNLTLLIRYEDIPATWLGEIRIAIVEHNSKGDRVYTYKKRRNSVDLRIRKKLGTDGRTAFESLLYDRKKRQKKHMVWVLAGNRIRLEHDENELL